MYIILIAVIKMHTAPQGGGWCGLCLRFIILYYTNVFIIVGVWVPLQRLLKSWANSSTIHVLLGSVLDVNRNGRRDNDQEYTWWVNNKTGGVAIPTHFYAMVVRCVNNQGLELADCKPEQLDAVGMLFQHPTEAGVSKLISNNSSRNATICFSLHRIPLPRPSCCGFL